MTLVADNLVLYSSLYEFFQCQKPLYAMAHRMMSYAGPLAAFASKCGALEGKRHNAVRVLEADEGFVVCPGGEADMGRTWWERNKADFRGHAGCVRSAIIGRAPLVPFGSTGAHEAEVVVLRGERIARVMRLDKLAHIKSWPLALTLPWGLQWGYFPYIPFPSRMEFRIGKPIEISPSKEEAFDLEYQHSVRDLLEARVQDLIDELLQARREQRHRVPSMGLIDWTSGRRGFLGGAGSPGLARREAPSADSRLRQRGPRERAALS